MQRTWITIALLTTALLASGCASTGQRAVEPMVWPEPPERARVRLIDLYHDASDVGSGQSVLLQAWDWLTGRTGDQARGSMWQPAAVIEHNGTIYVADSVLGVVHGYNKLKQRYFLGRLPNDPAVGEPVGIAATPDGRIFVTDSRGQAIHRFSAELVYQGLLDTAVAFQHPCGIWYDADHKALYVIDSGGHTLTALNDDGSLRWQTAGQGVGPGELNFPTYLCQRGEKIYVTDSLNFRVQIFNTEGRPLSSFGKPGRALGSFSMAKGIGVDSEGHIYVADANYNNIQIFRDDGRLLLYIGRGGIEPGTFSMPTGLFISENDTIFVADTFNRRIQVFQFLGGSR